MGQYRDAVRALGTRLAAYWLAEQSLTADSSGNGRDLAVVGAVTVGAGILNPLVDDAIAGVFPNVSGSYLNGQAGKLPPAPAAPGIAVESWASLASFNPTASDYRGIIATDGYMLRVGPAAPSAPTYQGYHFDSAGAGYGTSARPGNVDPPLNTVFHIGERIVDNGDGTLTQELYVNGVKVATRTNAGVGGTWRTPLAAVTVGRWSTRYWDGKLAHTAIYTDPLSGAHFAHHYRLGMGLERYAAPLRRFTFKAGTPATVDGSVALPLGDDLDLSDAYGAGGVVTGDDELAGRLRDLGIFDEAAA